MAAAFQNTRVGPPSRAIPDNNGPQLHNTSCSSFLEVVLPHVSLFCVFAVDYQWESCRKRNSLREKKNAEGRKEILLSIFLSYRILLNRTGLEILVKSHQAPEKQKEKLIFPSPVH